jgi:hypothetical protein
LVSVLVGALFARPLSGDERPKTAEDHTAPMPTRSASRPAAVQVRFTDESVLKLTLQEERIEFQTPYGKLLIPTSHVRRIEFATRISEDEARRMEAAAGNLGNASFRLREEAGAQLAQFGAKAYATLVQATRHTDPEVVRRAEKLLEQLREAFAEDQLEVRKYDVIYTEESKIAGRVEAASLKAHTAQFGDVQLKLADMHSLRSLTAGGEAEPTKALPDPGNLVLYQNQIGKTFSFQVTGSNIGTVWGTDVYTSDSPLAVAAVHAGVVKQGKTGVVKVKIVPSPGNFTGSTRNGVTTSGYGPHPGAYQILK